MEFKKRERAANFQNAEVQLLVSLVDKQKKIIENKKTDAVTNKDKEAAWKKIEVTFNACGLSSNVRSWKTLKLKYEGLKKMAKKKSFLQRQEMYKTGGGPSNAPDFNEVKEKVLDICSNIIGLEARYDSDTIIVPTTNLEKVLTPVEPINLPRSRLNSECAEPGEKDDDTLANAKVPDMDDSLILEIVEGIDSQKENQWKKWNPRALKTRVSNVLKSDTATKASVTGRLDKLSADRLELVQLQMEIAKKQHEFIEDEHKLKMLHLANDEARKQEIHELLVLKLKSNESSPGIYNI